MDSQLTAKGWYLSEEGLNACKVATGKENPTVNDIIKIALNCDLRQIARKQLPENINNGQTDNINGPLTLQVQKIRNVSAPLANQESKGAPRMIKLNLTDGCTYCIAIEFDSISFLNMNLIPGTKVCLIGSHISVVKGCILLDTQNIKLLGGEVETLKAKWEASKQVAATKRYGKINDDPPPAFTEFDSSVSSRRHQSNQRKHTSQIHRSKDDRHKDNGSAKQSYSKKSNVAQNDVKVTEERKNSVDRVSKKESCESKGNNERTENTRKADDHSDYNRRNTKNEYKTLWNGKKAEDALKNDEKKWKVEVNKEKRVNNSGGGWESDRKSSLSSDLKGKDKEKVDFNYKSDARSGERSDQTKEQPPDHHSKSSKIYVNREKQISYDKMKEKKHLSEHWRNDGHERKREEKYLWSDEKMVDEKVKFHYQKSKDSGLYSHVERGDKSKENRNSYRNEKEVSRDNRNLKEGSTDRRGSVKPKNERDKNDFDDSRKTDARSRTYQNDKNKNDNEKGRKDFDKRNDYDSTRYEKNVKKTMKTKEQWKADEDFNQDKKVVNNDGKKPVAYDARSQNWYYDGEMKDEREKKIYNNLCSDLVSVSFKEDSRHGKKGHSSSDVPLKGNDDYYYESKPHGKKNDKHEYNDDDYGYTADEHYSYKKTQKSKNSKTNNKNFPDRDKNESNKSYRGKQNKQTNNTTYSADAGYVSYDRNKSDRSNYRREDFQTRRQLSDDSHSSKGSKGAPVSLQGQKYTDRTSKGNGHLQSSDDRNSKYSPGKRIPLEILFGKNPQNNDCKGEQKHDNNNTVSQTISNVHTTGVTTSYQHTTPYAKISTKEIMERSLEQNPNHFSPISQDVLYMQYPNVNQLNPMNQEITYPYQQTIQTVPNFQVPPTSQYLGYNELPVAAAGAGGSSNAAAVAAAAGALNPYMSYPNPRNTFPFNPMHTQHQTLQQQLPQQEQTQTLGNDIPFFSANPYYYPVGNTQMTQLHEQYH